MRLLGIYIKTVICAGFALLATGGYAQSTSPDYKFTHVNINHGLSHNQVNSIIKDKTGFLWIGTASGLNRFDGYSTRIFRTNPHDSTSIHSNDVNRLLEMPDGKILVLASSELSVYDPAREKFDRSTSAAYQQYGIPNGILNDIVKDKAGRFWFLHTTQGIYGTDASGKKTMTLRHQRNSTQSIASDSVTAMAQDSKGRFWLTHTSGILEQIEITAQGYKVLYRSDYLRQRAKSSAQNYRILVDSDDDIWCFASNGNLGAFYFQPSTNTFRHLHKDATGTKLNTNIVRGIVQDNRGLIWIGTDHGGINVVNKRDFTVQYIYHREEDEKSLAQNSINTLYKDDQGIIWVGTFKKGVSYYHENILRFPLYKNYLLDPKSLPYEDVNRFVEDDKGNLWIGTNGGGLIYFDRANGTFKQYRNNPRDPGSLSSDVIVSLCIDHEKKLWIGTYYGGLNSFDGKRFTRYIHNAADPQTLGDVSVWEIFEDSSRRLWIGTLGGGVDLFDRRSKTFTHFRQGDSNSVQSQYIAAIAEDRQGNIWFGTDYGINVLEKQTGRFVYYINREGDSTSLSSNNVVDIKEDSDGRIWIGTHAGLNLFNPKSKLFQTFTEADGLPHNSILTILEDRRGNLWFGTPNGLSHMTITGEKDGRPVVQFRNYSEADGLQGKQFNENAALRTRRGELLFGGANGFNIFKPDQLGINTTKPRVVLSDFQLFNKSIYPGENIDGQVLLEKSITSAAPIVLPADKNVFSIEFAALNFFQPEKNAYKYRMEGFNGDWLTADSKSRKVTFTNLDPGDYVFRVIASNNDGVWNEEGARLQIKVLPPFWKSRTAFVLYVVTVILALLVTRKLIQQREQMKFAIQQERQEALRMHELDMMKIKFFTNVSHEFRTPLTLILTPLEKLLKQASEGEQRSHFELIQRNARRLLNLVNQLLDFRKMEVQEIKFQPSEGNIVKFIHETVSSFSDLSEKKDIKLDFQTSIESLETIFDQDKLEKILFNLLSNAFKFTPEHGAVTVKLDMTGEGDNRSIKIQVEDTGIGIAPDKLDRVFDRFFQNELPKSMVNQGSGIGLSITKEFVKIHGGSISAESELGKGSRFTVILPLKEISAIHEAAVVQEAATIDEGLVEPLQGVSHQLPVILLVEDNEDFRFYLKDNLKMNYEIVEAKDGLDGWKKALAYFPDLIVSDIMMPEMNGLEFCRKVKSDHRVSHIPVILLTARTSEEQKLEGFETGADDYINKPFNFEILESRIRNLIVQRDKLHKSLSKQAVIKASDLNITSLDEQFIQKAIKFVEDNVSNADFSVEDLSHELGISRAHFYKKILALTGKSPLEFIRAIRLQQAAQLLEKSQLTVAEVAYKVGFNNPKYFARYFKETYHVLPSAYASGKRRN